MSTAIQLFKHEDFGEVRVVGDSENPRFCLSDVCKVLAIGNPSDVKKRLDKGVDSIETLQTAGGMQAVTFINEDGLILRNAYLAWFYKKRIQEIEGIGIERDLAGFPVLIAPEGCDIWSESNAGLLEMCKEFVSNIRRDAMEGLPLPHGWELKLLSTGGSRQFDTNEVISRYNQGIARTVLADFIFLGSGTTGSWALSSDKTELFSMAIGAYLDIISETFNRKAIPQLIELNKKSLGKLTGYPELRHGDIEVAEYDKLAPFLKDLIASGVLTPDESLEDYIRATYSLPPRVEN